MRKTITRLTMAAWLAFVLAGCGMLWAPLEERSNPLDPKVESVPVVLSLYPEPGMDGYVDNGGYRYFAGAEIKVGDFMAPHCRGLIRFDLSAAPLVVDQAKLRVYCQIPGPPLPGLVQVYRITVPWDPMSIDWGTVFSGSFVDALEVAELVMNTADRYYECDVTVQVQTMIEQGKPFGFLLVPNQLVPYTTHTTLTSSRSPEPPVLELTGYDTP